MKPKAVFGNVSFNQDAIEYGIGKPFDRGTVIDQKRKGSGILMLVQWEGRQEPLWINKYWLKSTVDAVLESKKRGKK